MLTGNSHSEEKTSLGNVYTDSKGSVIYVKQGQISFVIKAEAKKYFADTKASGVAKYLQKNRIIFAAELTEEVDELEIYVTPVPLQNAGRIEEGYIAFLEERLMEGAEYFLIDAKILETERYQDTEFYHIYYSTRENHGNEYQFGSSYLMETEGQCVVLNFIRYMDKEPDFVTGERKMDPVATRIMKTVSFGDATNGIKPEEENALSKLLSFSFSLWIFLIPIFYFLSRNVSVAVESGEWQEDILGRERSKTVLGLFAVLIVLHHLVQYVGSANAGVISFMENCGVLFVGAYFFYSGYGLFYSFKHKEGYMKGFVKNRLPVVLIPFYVSNLVYILNWLIIERKPFQKELFLQLLGIRLINDHSWYIIEIVILYLVFWLIFKFIKNERIALAVMTVLVLLMMNGSLLLGHGAGWFQGEWWYNATFLFIIGMLVARGKGRIIAFAKRHYTVILVVTGIAFISLYAGNSHMLERYGYWTASVTDKYRTLAIQLPLIISFTFLMVLLSMKIKCDNAVIRFFGKISLELYLIHNLFLQNFSFIRGKGMYFLLVYAGAILLATLMNRFDTFLINLIYKRKVRRNAEKTIGIKALLSGWKKQMYLSLRGIKHNPKGFIRTSLREIFCFLWALVTLFPIYLMIVNATKSRIFGMPLLLPGKSFLDNLQSINAAFAGPKGGIMSGIRNSLIVATTTALLSTYLGALTAYAFERYKFKGKKQLWAIVIACLMIPQSVACVGIYKIIVKLGLLNNLWVIILLSTASPAAVYFIRMYLKNLNLVEIGEAARIDGASEFAIFNRIILPIIQPVLALQLTFSFSASWNNGFVQNLFLMGWKKKTIALYLEQFAGSPSFSPEEYALFFVATLPPLIVYILCSKSIVSSITLGAVKE